MFNPLLLPLWQLMVVTFGFGVIIGSFLNVYIYRFHTGKSLAGSSHCLSCQTDLRWYELFPLVSYLGLRGRCRTCGARIPGRYFWVELATALLFVAVVVVEPLWWLWPVMAITVAVLVVTAVYDLYHLVIPREFIWTLSGLAIIMVGYQWYAYFTIWSLADHLTAPVFAFLFFGGLWWYSGGQWIGFGDAKLVVPLAFLLGSSGTFSMIVLSFWVGTMIVFGVMAYHIVIRNSGGQIRFAPSTKRLTMKSEVPFAPFLIIAFLLVWLLHIDVLVLLSYALPF